MTSAADLLLTPRRARLGAAAWIGAVVATLGGQFLAQIGWNGRDAYSWLHNDISDLGMATCRTWGSDERFACSPWHEVANAGFAAYGLLLVAGVVAWLPLLHRTTTGIVAAGMLCLTGIGSALVGAAPADTNGGLHATGAALVFVCGNLAMLLALPSLRAAGMRATGHLGIALGIAGLVCIPLFLGDVHLGIGRGGIERVVVWSLDVWNIALAVTVLRRVSRRE